jgi:hypothetical protein
MPNLANWVAPTLNVEELEKRIEELKAVHFWLEQNSRALGATIQALEVQKMTLATLKGMNFNIGDVANAFKLKAADSVASGVQRSPTRPLPAKTLPVATGGRQCRAQAPARRRRTRKTGGKPQTASRAPSAGRPAAAVGRADAAVPADRRQRHEGRRPQDRHRRHPQPGHRAWPRRPSRPARNGGRQRR